MIGAQQADNVTDEVVVGVDVDDVLAADAEPTLPSPTPTTQPPPQELPSTSQVASTPPSSPIAQPSSPPQQQQPSQPTTLKKRVSKLKKKNKLKVSGLRRLRKVETTQRIESFADTVMDDQEDTSKRIHPSKGGVIELIDADKDVTLEEVNVDKNAEDDKLETVEHKDVVEVVTTAKLMTKVVTAAAATITIATTPINAATVIAAPKKVQKKEKEDNDVLRYQALKRKPQTEAQARKNMMIYLRNMDGFQMDYFKGMRYDDIRPIFEKYFNSNVAFLEKTKEQLEEEESRALKRTSESLEEKAAEKQKLDEEVEELKKHLQIVPNNDDDVYTEATPLALKIVKERFASSKPKNFSDDFLLTALTFMFEKPDVEAQV
nr:hypothetical protein [Tanacetum cinerariifolium]